MNFMYICHMTTSTVLSFIVSSSLQGNNNFARSVFTLLSLLLLLIMSFICSLFCNVLLGYIGNIFAHYFKEVLPSVL